MRKEMQTLLDDIELDIQELKYLMQVLATDANPTLKVVAKRNIQQMRARLDALQKLLDETPVEEVAIPEADVYKRQAYNNVKWKIEADYSRIFVIRTFVVHPSFLKMGIGRTLMDYSFELAQQSGIKSIRLDVYENNLPAISLYEKCGFEYIDTVDLGFGNYGLDWFKLYEKLV